MAHGHGHVHNKQNLQHLLDVGFKVRAEYGTSRLQLAEILDLQSRGLVELERAPDGFVDLFIDDQRIARGEVLAMNNRYAVRITEIMETRRDRAQSTPIRTNVYRKEDIGRTNLEDLISLDNYDDDDGPDANVHDHSIADAYEFPSLDNLASRRDDPAAGPNDPHSATYSPRRSVPKPPGR